MGLFKPYWQKEYKDASVIAPKLDKESQEMLKTIAKEAPDKFVRSQALLRITDEQFLKEILNNVEDMPDIWDIIHKIEDSDYLTENALFNSSASMRYFAYEELVKRNYEIRDNGSWEEYEQKTEELDNQLISLLRKAEGKFSFPRDSIKAVKEPEDLKKIILYDSENSNREEALEHAIDLDLNDDPVLAPVVAKLVVEEKEPKIRWYAACFSHDQKALAHAALNDEIWEIRRAAVNKLTDIDILTKVALNDPDEDVRKLAAERTGKESLVRKVERLHEHRFEYFNLYEKNGNGQMEKLSRFRKCKDCGQTFCCDDLYKSEPFCNYPWSFRHIETSRDGERICLSCAETGDSFYGYIL
ncbi:MAG: HEAT repeat domain-containing protein [Saccharofermentans sp.]|nr:HEAT repeat domain-containing protein [Saccharofermentans sp.]